MSGKAKIEGLTNAWYGFAVFSAIFSLVTNGIGVFSIVSTALSLFVSFLVIFFLGRRLIKKSNLTRMVLLLVSGLLSILGGVAAVKTSMTFVQTWQFSLLFTVGYSAISTWMYGRSFRVLMDGSVKQYIG